MPDIEMRAEFDDPAMGSCRYNLTVSTEVPPEAGDWHNQIDIENVFETWIDHIVGGDFEDVIFTFWCNGQEVRDPDLYVPGGDPARRPQS